MFCRLTEWRVKKSPKLPRHLAYRHTNWFRRPLRFESLEDRRLLALITVNTLVDEDDGISQGAVSLRDAINDANPNDTIQFDVEGTIALTNGELLINKNLSIVGPGAHRLAIDARGESRVFNVDNGNSGTLINVSIANLTITGGNTGADGGGILNRETLLVSGCHITGNSAEDGGGIANFAGTFAISNSTISHNTAFGALGGGAGIFSFASGKSALSVIDSSTISNNISTSRGGGIYNFEGTIAIEYSTITDNDSPTSQGSGIASLGDTLRVATQLRSTIVAGNLHSDVDVVVGFQPTFASNGFNLIGFGTATGSFSLSGDQVINTADPLLGPLTDNGGPTPTHLPLVGSPAIDTGNSAFMPPPLYDQRGSLHPRVFDGNGDSVARIDKGAVERDIVSFVVDTLVDEDDLNFSAGDFSLREAIGQAALITLGTPTIVFAPSLTAGGPTTISLTLGTLGIANRMNIEGPGAGLLTIDAEHASRIFNVDDHSDASQVEVQISGLTLTDGFDTNGGGAILNQEKLTIRDSVITGNSAQWGGGIYNAEFGTLVVERSRITANHAIEPVPMAIGSGGALYNWAGKVSIIESTISGNDSVSHGGAILNANNGTIFISRSTISNNTAAANGGGIHNGDGNITVASSTISGNHAVLGGGVFVNTPNHRVTVLSNSTISGNVAPLGGGGVDNLSGQVFFEFCTITENVSNDFAGSGVLSSPSVADSPTSFYSTIIAANFDPSGVPGPGKLDVASGATNSLISRGYNIVGLGGFVNDTFNQMGDQIIGQNDPLLGPLADNGGPTLTHSLLSSSPALDQGDSSPTAGIVAVPKFDQRGKPFARIRDGDVPASIVMDVGAFEAQGIPPALPGDYNLSGTVDGADYVAWRNSLGVSGAAYTGADGNGNGIVDQGDYGVWRSQFGKTFPAAAASKADVVGPVEIAQETIEPTEPIAIKLDSPLNAPGDSMSATATAQIFFASVVEPTRPDARSEAPSPALARRSDAALLAWLATRSESHRATDNGVTRRAPNDWHEWSLGDTAHTAATDAAFVALLTAL